MKPIEPSAEQTEYPDWQTRAETELGVTFEQLYPVSGGDFAQSYRAKVSLKSDACTQLLDGGDTVFIKTHSNPPPRHFTTEASGLRWLAETDSVSVPIVLGCSDEQPYLALRWIAESNSRTSAGEKQLGRQLAAMHQYACDAFGREDERSTGSLGLPNRPCHSWAEFYATQRLLPLMEIAARRDALSTATLDRIETVATKLDNFCPPDARASRLHGDLWAGNRLIDTSGHSWMIDPASHGGHREFDLAMMRLFGGFDQACFDAYHESYPLQPEWQERISLHQLAPLIVHAIKFGHSYVGPTEDALAQYC